MNEKHKPGKDGWLEDGVSYYPADAHSMQTFEDAKRDLSQFSSPVLVHANNPHERLYIAAFDGTGNDGPNDPQHATNVYKINEQVEILRQRGHHQIEAGYVAGPGTQDNPIDQVWDSMRGHTYDVRLEEMYAKFIKQAKEWRNEDPNVQIRIADIGFSRGAEQATGFARLVHERGIQDFSGAHYTYDASGQITHVNYSKPPIVAPGKVAQVVGLFDPVGTGVPVNDKDRRLPPSVISGFQLIAASERRGQFKSSHIIDPGMTPDGRFLGVMIGGAHSDTGGSYHRDGLGIRSDNLMIDYLNSLSDQTYLSKAAEPDDPRRNVVHRSEEGLLLYRVSGKIDRSKPEGYEERLVPKDQVNKVPDAYNAEPRDEALNRQFERRKVQIGQVPGERAPSLQQGALEISSHADPQTLQTTQKVQADTAHTQRLSENGLQPADPEDDVGVLQQQLRSLGYTDARGRPLQVDGQLGLATHAAVQAFQHEHGLAVDGIAGPHTRAALHQQTQQERQHTQRLAMTSQPSAAVTAPSARAQAEPQAVASTPLLHVEEIARATQQAVINQQIITQVQRMAAEEKEAAQRVADERMTQERAAAPTPPHEPVPIPAHLRDFRHPDHPMHQRYQHTLEEVHYMEDQHKIQHGEHSERLAAAVVDRLHEERFGQLEKLQLRGQGQHMEVVAHQSRPSVYMPEREVRLSINQATARPMEAVAHDWSKRAMPHLHEPIPVMASEPLPHPRNLPAHDLRHPDHPQHALYQHVHTRVADAFAKAGVPRSEAQLEHATAATLLQAQINQVDWSKPAQIALAQDPVTGAIGPDSKLSIRTHDHVFGELQELVPASAMQQAPEVSFQQMGQVAQQQAQEWTVFEQQRAQANMQQNLYPAMPGGGQGGGL